MADTPPTANTMVATIGATVAKNLLMILGSTLATHGILSGAGTETFVSLGMVLVGAGWSFWNSYGRAIVLAKLDVWKATAQAQAEALRKANVAAPTAAQIADKIPDPTVTASTVAKVVSAGCLALILLAGLTPASAQPSLAPQKRVTAPRTDSAEMAVPAGSPEGTLRLGGIISRIKAFTTADLTAAAEDAEAQLCPDGSLDASGQPRVCPDPAGKCWRVLIPLVQAQQSPLPSGLGLAQAIQKARDLRRKVQAGVPDAVKEACAIVLWDAEKTLLQFGLRLAPIPGLPGLP